MADKPTKKLPEIKTRAQLKMVIDGLSEQGFGYYVGDWKAHEYKVNNLIHKNNTLGIEENKFKSELNELVSDMTNYDEIDKTIKKFFQRFKPDDKIKELLNHYYLKPEASCIKPSHSSASKKEITDWVKFKRRYNIKGEPDFDWSADVYNLDKNFIKVNDYDSKYDFEKLYKLLFNEEPNDFSLKNLGDWQDLGKIQIKVFANGSINIKGDLDQLKSYLYKEIRNFDCIIYYNNKREIRERRRD